MFKIESQGWMNIVLLWKNHVRNSSFVTDSAEDSLVKLDQCHGDFIAITERDIFTSSQRVVISAVRF